MSSYLALKRKLRVIGCTRYNFRTRGGALRTENVREQKAWSLTVDYVSVTMSR